MKAKLTLLGSAGLYLVLAGTAAADGKLRIGLVLPDLSNAIIADIDAGARARAGELGTVEILTSASYSGEEQAKAVENYVVQHVDAIVYDSIDAAAVGPAVKKANDAKIPTIAIFSAGAGAKDSSFRTPDFTENGRIIGRWMAKKVGPNGIVAEVEGNPADAAGNELTAGFKEGLAQSGIKGLVASAPSNWDRQKALAVATDILTAHPDLQGLYGANDDVALGSLQAVKAAGRKGSVVVAGQNGTCEALASIVKGDLDFTVMNFAKQLGRLSVDLAVKLHNGEKVQEKIAAPVFGIDTPTAQAIAAGDTSAVQPDLVADVSARVKAAKSGCK
jgi:ribose transport system substrate-binding protein